MTDILQLLPRMNYDRALQFSTIASIFVHGLLLGTLALPLSTEKPLIKKEEGISIELTDLKSAPKASLAQPPEIAVKEDTLVQKHIKPENPDSLPVPQKIIRKVTTRKPARKTEGKIKEKNSEPSAVVGASKSSPSSPQIMQPIPLGGANNSRPVYPELARKRGQEGIVRIRCQVDGAGNVISAGVAVSSGHKLLDDAALKTVNKWRFRPATNNGATVNGTVIVPVEFRLR